jgi:hypothetical protein
MLEERLVHTFRECAITFGVRGVTYLAIAPRPSRAHSLAKQLGASRTLACRTRRANSRGRRAATRLRFSFRFAPTKRKASVSRRQLESETPKESQKAWKKGLRHVDSVGDGTSCGAPAPPGFAGWSRRGRRCRWRRVWVRRARVRVAVACFEAAVLAQPPGVHPTTSACAGRARVPPCWWSVPTLGRHN